MATRRNMKDAGLRWESYLPAAGESVQTPTMDLGATVRGVEPMGELVVTVPAAANHTDSSKIITLTLQQSADDVTYANVSPLIQCRVPGVGTTGSLETTFQVPIPSSGLRYYQFTTSVPSGDGDVTGVLATFELTV